MANNSGFLLMAGLGALLFLGRGGVTKTTDEESRLMASSFNLQSYIDSLFGAITTVPVQGPVMLTNPDSVVVTSSGVATTTKSSPAVITGTTKVQIGGDGGETITASALAVLRSEQLKEEAFRNAANVFTVPIGETEEKNRRQEERQKQFARDLIAKNIAAQADRAAKVLATTRLEQENIAKNLNPDGSNRALPAGMKVIGFDYSEGQPVIAIDDTTGQWTYSHQSTSEPGTDIIIDDSTEVIDVDFSTGFNESFVLSGGMDSPDKVTAASLAIGF